MENKTTYFLVTGLSNVKIKNSKRFCLNQKKCAGINMILELENRWSTI